MIPFGRVPGGAAMLLYLPEVETMCNSRKTHIASHSKGRENKPNSKARAVKKKLFGGIIASCILQERDVFRDESCLTKVN